MTAALQPNYLNLTCSPLEQIRFYVVHYRCIRREPTLSPVVIHLGHLTDYSNWEANIVLMCTNSLPYIFYAYPYPDAFLPVTAVQAPQHTNPSVNFMDNNASPRLPSDSNVKGVTEESLRHADLELEASGYKTIPFRQTLLKVFQTIQVPTWTSAALESEHVQIAKVSGGFTNAVFFVSYSTNTSPASTSIPQSPASSAPHLIPSYSHTSTPCTVLLRIYGPSSSTFISRTDELRMLHILSSVYSIGPRVFGTFQGGRVEEWFDSDALALEDLRDPVQSRWIGMRMRELHSVDVLGVVGPKWDGQETVLKNLVSWREPAREVLNILKAKEDRGEISAGHVWHGVRQKLDLAEFARVWDAYWSWLQKWEDKHGRSKTVFAHNDTQYGNLLRLKEPPIAKPDHYRLILIDFEFAAPNPAAFDIATHFHEWIGEYHSSPNASHMLTSSRYPTRNERQNFYRGYLGLPTPGEQLAAFPASAGQSLLGSTPTSVGQIEMERLMDTLDAQVYGWSPASYGMWVTWWIVRASEDVTNGAISDYDYLKQAIATFDDFKGELVQRGIEW